CPDNRPPALGHRRRDGSRIRRDSRNPGSRRSDTDMESFGTGSSPDSRNPGRRNCDTRSRDKSPDGTNESTRDRSSRNRARCPSPRPRAPPARSTRSWDNKHTRTAGRPPSSALRHTRSRTASTPNHTARCTPTVRRPAPGVVLAPDLPAAGPASAAAEAAVPEVPAAAQSAAATLAELPGPSWARPSKAELPGPERSPSPAAERTGKQSWISSESSSVWTHRNHRLFRVSLARKHVKSSQGHPCWCDLAQPLAAALAAAAAARPRGDPDQHAPGQQQSRGPEVRTRRGHLAARIGAVG